MSADQAESSNDACLQQKEDNADDQPTDLTCKKSQLDSLPNLRDSSPEPAEKTTQEKTHNEKTTEETKPLPASPPHTSKPEVEKAAASELEQNEGGLDLSLHNSGATTSSNQEDKSSGSMVGVVASHYNALEEVGLKERNKSRIFYMRNFNNWIKSTLIGAYLSPLKERLGRGVPMRVLDLGCGKGGDLLKWMRGGVTHVVCADVAEVSIQHCEHRYQEITSRKGGHQPLFSAQFITADCTKERLRNMYKKPNDDCIDPTLKFHLVSCQFAFHYCFESLQQADCMLQNAAECLEPGGYFIGTIPNAYEIVRRHKAAGCDTFGNDVYQITMEEGAKSYPLFGAKYNFHLHEVVDCPEFLVHFPTLKKLAEKHSLKLVEKFTFGEYYNKCKDSGRFLLQKINGLEVFPAHRDTSLLGKEEDYKHAGAFLSENPRVQSVGTLSQPEWEAASLYMVFAFEKVKRQMSLDDFPDVSEAKKRGRKLGDESDRKTDR